MITAQVWSICDQWQTALQPWHEAGYTVCSLDIERARGNLPSVMASIHDVEELPGAEFVLAWPLVLTYPLAERVGGNARDRKHWPKHSQTSKRVGDSSGLLRASSRIHAGDSLRTGESRMFPYIRGNSADMREARAIPRKPDSGFSTVPLSPFTVTAKSRLIALAFTIWVATREATAPGSKLRSDCQSESSRQTNTCLRILETA